MPPSQPFQKRIKRHIIGPNQKFFIATEPHVTRICFDEFKTVFPDIHGPEMVTGGIEFTGRLTDGYLANLKLRTANRVLMRISEFKATNFSQLEKKIQAIFWELYLNPSKGIYVHVTTEKSRLYHTHALKNRITDAIIHQIPGLFFSNFGQGIFIRVIHDKFTVSLDSSGDLLYKRGIKLYGHKAPIRETLAAAALKKAGFEPNMTLIDPLCGSGTFSIEAALMTKQIPPGWFRKFAFMDWPAFKKKQWEYFKTAQPINQDGYQNISIFASDKNETACRNLKKALEESGLTDIIQVNTKDFFSFHPSEISENTGLVVINPPYGLRLERAGESAAFFKKIIRQLHLNYKNWKFILIVPRKKWLKDIPFEHEVFPLFHGGLTVDMVIGKI